MKEVTILEKKLKETDNELNKKMEENENSLKKLQKTNQKYNEDYNDLNNKIIQLEEEINKLKKENKILLNKNSDLMNDNESLLKEQNNNNKIISSYKEKIDKLNDEISSLNKIIETYKKEIEELKIIKNKEKIIYNNENDNDNDKNKNNLFEDEIVIVNKETTYTKGFGNGSLKNGELKHSYEIKRNKDINVSEINKYHDIIQDLTNMILIYENFFFKKDVKPKNNKELFCYLMVQYINNIIKRIKLNTLVNLIIYKESQPKRYKYKNTNEIGNSNDNYGSNRRHRNYYSSGRRKSKNNDK